MADQAPVVHIGENSPERVAYVLTHEVLWNLEGLKTSQISRELYLDTYAECLRAVRGLRHASLNAQKQNR